MTTPSCSTTWHSMCRTKWTPMTRRRTASWLASPPSYKSAWRSTWGGGGHYQSLSVMSSSWMMLSAHTRMQRRGRPQLLRPTVLLPGTGRCTTTAPPTCLISSTSTSVSSNSGFPAHLSTSISRRLLGLYLHHRSCCVCLCHRSPKQPPALPASIVATQATSRESAPHPRRTPLRATSSIHHVVHKRWLLPRPATSTTPLWKTFLSVSKSS
jgi:hypothetical protein